MSSSKQELIHLIGIHLKDFTWKVHERLVGVYYDKDIELCIIIQNMRNGLEDNYEIYMNINDTWEQNKKRIDLNITQYIRECIICNEIKKLRFCDKCLNQYCNLCHAHIIIKNEGKTICPFCRNGGIEDDFNNLFSIKACNAMKKLRYLTATLLVESKSK